MILNDLIQTTRPTIAQLITPLKEKDLYVDDTFQRRLVWTEKQKARLIETVLIGFPMPEIYLWQQAADVDSGKQKQSIVDGQQRLTALSQFLSNEFELKSKYLDDKNSAYANKSWKDLDNDLKTLFWNYVINVRTIPHNINIIEIKDVFKRLNETDRSLNPQELRNAEFNGLFIQAAELIADLESFTQLKVFTEHQIRRMTDIQFASSLLIFLRRGTIEENPQNINDTYDMYNDEYAERDQDLITVENFLYNCHNIYFLHDRVREMFSKQVHLFTLFCFEQILLERNIEIENIQNKLNEFVNIYENHVNTNSLIEKYREGAVARTRSRASRSLRLTSLTKWMLDEKYSL